MKIPFLKDITQEIKQIRDFPEIRVWAHPHRIGMKGEDYFQAFPTFREAFEYIFDNKEIAEEVPLLAFRGYEINLFEMK